MAYSEPEFNVARSLSPKTMHRARLLVMTMLIAIVGISPAVRAAAPTNKVRFYMNMGTVEIELYGNESPLNVANFLSYVDNGSYDDSFVHRTRDNAIPPDRFIQGGSYGYPINNFIDGNPITTGPPVVNEFNAANGLSNVAYTLAAARSTHPDSATSGWFINQSNNAAAFDAGPYTVLGKVTIGTSIIDQIPFLPNYGPFQGTPFESMPIYNGDLVTILRAARIPVLAGDFNFSGTVTSADYSVWRSNFGSTTHAAADGNGNGIVDAADFVIWRNAMTLGAGAGDLTPGNVPEPAGMLLFLSGCSAAWLALRRRRHSPNYA
jgi:cyclophilin family peptidyl-prolyl cis-trans isomerase